MRATLFYNPVAGRHRGRRSVELERVAAVLVGHGYKVERVATTLPSTAVEQVRAAIVGGSGVVFACGGDGTVHDVLQGVVDAGDGRPVLGVIPMGSGSELRPCA